MKKFSQLWRRGNEGQRSIRLAKAAPVLPLIIALAPALASSYSLFKLELILLYATTALGIFLTMRVSGEFMIGHVAIVAAAAYAVGWMNTHHGWNSIETLPIAMIAGLVGALLLGLPSFRLDSFYLGTISFFIVLIIPDVTTAFTSITGGEVGLPVTKFGFGRPLSDIAVYEVVVGILLVSFLFVRNIVRSTLGARLQTLRDAPQALQAGGVSIRTTKVYVYVLSSVPASLAGWMFAHVNGIVLPGFYSLSLTLLLVAAAIVGGRRSALGVVAAACVLSGYTQLVGPFSKYNELGLGLVLVVTIIAVPSGFDTMLDLRRRRRGTTVRTEPPNDEGDTAPSESNGHPPRCDLPRVPAVPTDDAPVLVVSGVSRSFGGNLALNDVSFSIYGGRVVGVVGPNGSGKTTLVNVISGFLEPNRGTVSIAGSVATGLPPHRVSRMGVSRTFQVPRLVDDLSVRRNIEVGLLNRAQDPLWRSIVGATGHGQVVQERATALRSVTDLLRLDPEILEAPARSLSLGMKRIVEMGRAVATGARVLCLDEPAAGLNHAEIDRLEKTLRDIVASGRSVLLVEHHMQFVINVCDDILVLERGARVDWWTNSPDEAVPEALQRHIGVSR
ncbi:MAG: ATP-binding cassette domain-containing protein [Actinomycetota bacterium]